MCKSNVVQNRKEYYNSFRDTHYKKLAQNLHDVCQVTQQLLQKLVYN